MKISVILCTYNGECFIESQLQSIYNQTRCVDEVLIFDDKSTDNTISLINKFIKKNALSDKWKLIVNSENKGWRRNFIDGFHSAKGELIFPCDQDDIWLDKKVEIMANILETEPRVDVLGCQFHYYYDKGCSIQLENLLGKFSKNDSIPIIKKTDKDVLITRVPGCALAFKSSLIPLIDKVWYPERGHDSIISTISKLKHSFYTIDTTLIIFRRHQNNNTPSNIKTVSCRIKETNNVLKGIKLLIENADILQLDRNAKALLSNLNAFYQEKLYFFNTRNLIKGLKLIKYLKYYPSFKSFIGDYFIVYRCYK